MDVRHVLRIGVLGVSVAGLVSACGTTPVTTPGASTSISASGSSGPAASIPDNLLTFAYPKDWPNLDPSVAFSAEPDVLAQVYETLAVFDPANGGEVTPGLATSWEHNEDGTVWTFHLRSGVKFQDGSDFNADAVKFTIERSRKINKGPAYLYDAVKSVESVDPLTAQINLSEPRPMDLIMAAGWGAFILSPTSDDQTTEWFQDGKGIGTGPYMWESYQHGQSAVLARFPNYWGGWKPGQFTKVVYNLTPDAATREQQVITGDAQLTFNVPLQDLANLSQRDDLHVEPLNIAAIHYLLFNTARAPLDNVKVRQALAYSWPEDQIVSSVYGSSAVANTTSLIPDGMWGHTTDLKGYSYDLDKAKQLLADAGHPNGGFTIDFAYTSSYPEAAQIAQLWKASLEQLGITLNVSQMSFNALIATIDTPTTAPFSQMELWPPTYPSPQDYLFSVFGSDQGGNISFYKNSDLDDLLAKGLGESATDQETAAETFKQAQQAILDDAPGIPVVDQKEVFVAPAAVSNFVSRGFTIWLYALTR